MNSNMEMISNPIRAFQGGQSMLIKCEDFPNKLFKCCKKSDKEN